MTKEYGAQLHVNVPQEIVDLLDAIVHGAGAKDAALVGGAVRNGMRGLPIRDYDILVEGSHNLEAGLAQVGYNVTIGSGSGPDEYILLHDLSHPVEILVVGSIKRAIDGYPDDISQVAVFQSALEVDDIVTTGELYITDAAITAFTTNTITHTKESTTDRQHRLLNLFPTFKHNLKLGNDIITIFDPAGDGRLVSASLQ